MRENTILSSNSHLICKQPQAKKLGSALNYSARKLSTLSSLAVPELDDSPIASGEAAICGDSLFIEVGRPEISWKW